MLPLSLVLLVASTPIGDDPNYQQAIALYEDVEFEQALFRFQSVAVRTDLNDAERAELFLWMGLCYGNIGELETAKRHFVDGLTHFPDAPLPQPNTSPLIIDVFKEARAEVKAKVANTRPPSTTSGAPEPQEGVKPEEPAAQGASAADDETGIPWLLVGGGAAGGVGALLVVAGLGAATASALVFVQTLALADDPNTFASDLQAGALAANVTLGAGVGLLAVGLVVLLAGGATAGASFVLE